MRHARRERREDAPLVDDPTRAGIGLAELLDDPDVGGQVDFRAAQGAGQRHVEQAGVRQRLEQRARQLARGVDLLGAGADLRGQGARRLEQ